MLSEHAKRLLRVLASRLMPRRVWGMLWGSRGYFPESKILLTDVLETRERTLGAEHPDTLASVNDLANCLSDMGQLKDAEALHRRALEAQWAHPRCGASFHIALSQQFGKLPPGQGQLKDAEALHRRALEAQWAHPRCGASFHIGLSQQFGKLLLRHGPAERCRSAPTGELWRPVSAPSVCRASFHIGLSQQFGKLPPSQGPAERCRSALQESFGGQWAHPRCGPSWHIGLSQQFGKLPQGQGPAERCRSALQESFGGPVSAPSVRSILPHWPQSTIWQIASRPGASWKMQKRSTGELWRPVSAPSVRSILTHWISVNNLADCLKARGQLKDAEALHRRALEARERTLGAEHPDTLPQSTIWQTASRPWASWKMQKRSTGELWRPRSAPSVRTILIHWPQSTIWQFASRRRETFVAASTCSGGRRHQ